MAGFLAPSVSTTILANGDVPQIGYVTVSNSSLFVVGATVSLMQGSTVAMFQVVDVQPAMVGLRSPYAGTGTLNALNYGFSSVAAFTTGATLYQDSQFIYSSTTGIDATIAMSILDPAPSTAQIAFGSLYTNQGKVVTCSRSSTAWCVTGLANPIIKSLAANTVRVEPSGLLVERSHTNILTNSVGNGGTWANSAAGPANTAAANAGIAPDGTNTATMVTYNSVGGGGWSWWQQSISGAGAGTYTLSLWIKAGTVTSVGLGMFDSVNGGSFFNTRQVALTSSWQRFTLTFTAPNGLGNISIGGQTFFGGTSVALGTLFISDVQVEAGSYAHSFVFTNTTAATGAADAVSVSPVPAGLPVAAGSAEFKFIPEWSTLSSGAFLTTRAAPNSGGGIEFFMSGLGLNFLTQNNGTNGTITSSNLTWNPGQTYFIKGVWGDGNLYLYRDNVLVASQTDGNAHMPSSHDAMLLGEVWIAGFEIDGWLSDIVFRNV